nr:fumarate hydratase [Campylobacter curvus]
MDKEKAVQKMTEIMAKFVGYTGKVLPDDVTAKLSELSERETQPLAREIYKTMFENQRLAKARPPILSGYGRDPVFRPLRCKFSANRRA